MLNRPDVIEGVHTSMLDAGAEVVETDTFQASRLKLEEWGLDEHTLEINQKAAEIARKAAGEDRFVAGSIGPTGHLPASDDPTLGKITFRELVERLRASRPRGLIEGGADLIIIETAQDILEVKAAIFGAREAFKNTGKTLPIQTQRLPAAQRRQDAAGHRHPGGAHHPHRARRAGHRPELLDRPRGHARRDPLPRREHPAAGPLHPQRRPAPPGPRRRDDLPRGARARWRDTLQRLRRALRRRHRRRLLRHHAGPHRGDRGQGRRQDRRRAPRAGRGDGLEHDDRRPAGPGAAPDPRRRARELPGLAQGQGDAAGRRLRRPASPSPRTR